MNEEENNPKTKTKATKHAVFEYCDSLMAQGFNGDLYKAVRERFGAGYTTIAPHIKAWEASRPKADEWVITDVVQAIADECVSKIWSATCSLAQSKLGAAMHELQTKLRCAEAVGDQYAQSVAELSERLIQEQEKNKQLANEAIECASEFKEVQDELGNALQLVQAYEALKLEHESLQKDLRDTERKLDRLEGKYEAMLEKRGEA